MQITASSPTTHTIPQGQPKFGHLANKKEFEEIKAIASAQGLNSDKLNPHFAIINGKGGMLKAIQDGVVNKDTFNNYKQWLSRVSIPFVSQPFMVTLENTKDPQMVDKFLKTTPQEVDSMNVAEYKMLNPAKSRGKSDTQVLQMVLDESPCAVYVYKTGPKQLLLLQVPYEREDKPKVEPDMLLYQKTK